MKKTILLHILTVIRLFNNYTLLKYIDKNSKKNKINKWGYCLNEWRGCINEKIFITVFLHYFKKWIHSLSMVMERGNEISFWRNVISFYRDVNQILYKPYFKVQGITEN